jgi:malate synthase
MKDILFFTSQSEEMLNVKHIGISIEGLQNGKGIHNAISNYKDHELWLNKPEWDTVYSYGKVSKRVLLMDNIKRKMDE